eukprot:s3646_g10.t1
MVESWRKNVESPIQGFVGHDPDDEDDDNDDENRLPNAPVLPIFVQDLAARVRDLGLDPADQEFDLPVRTWFIDHLRIRRWFAPRLMYLHGPLHEWEEQIASLWADMLNPSEWFDVTLVDPQPPRAPRYHRVAFDMIVSQSIDLPRFAGLVTVHPSRKDPSFQMYSVAVSFPERVSGYEVIQRSDAARYCRYQHCTITQRWNEIPNTLREAHVMGHGDSFQVFVLHRDPSRISSNDASGSDSKSANPNWDEQVAHHANTSTPSASSTDPIVPMQHGSHDQYMTIMHIFQLEGQPILLSLVNDQDISPSLTIAQALGIFSLHSLEVLHQVPYRPDDIPRDEIIVIAQRSGDLEPLTRSRLILVDVFYHNHPSQEGHLTRPAQTRTVHAAAHQIVRSTLMVLGNVFSYCNMIADACTVQMDGQPWDPDDLQPRPVNHGSYARVDVPPPQGFDLPTQQAASTVEQDVTISELLGDDDDATSLIQSHADLHPSFRPLPLPELDGHQGEGPLSTLAVLNPLVVTANPSDEVQSTIVKAPHFATPTLPL